MARIVNEPRGCGRVMKRGACEAVLQKLTLNEVPRRGPKETIENHKRTGCVCMGNANDRDEGGRHDKTVGRKAKNTTIFTQSK